MKFLRTVSTRRLLAGIAGLLVAVVAGTAIAVAAAGTGPVPKPKRLAQAVHAALAAPSVAGISARISFTNHLIDASDLQGSDPILSGATGRLWLSGHRLRLELQSDNGDAQVVVDHNSFWISDPSSNTVYEGKLPADRNAGAEKDAVPSLAEIQSDINKLARRVDLSGAMPTDVAGQPTYTVKVSPKHDGGLLGSVKLAWDAVQGVPLRFAVYARDQATPVLELKATDISYGAVSASDFAISPPSGAKVVKVSTPNAGHGGAVKSGAPKGSARSRGHRLLEGAAAVAKRLPFSLVAPKQLVGLPRRSVTLLDWANKPAALVTYGQNLGGIAVLEQTPSSAGANGSAAGGGDRQSLKLPTVSINGATAQELDTALGTVVRFTRDGVAYTVLGSVPPAAADLAARGL